MADRRNYATWQPDAVINERIQKQEGIQTNWQYRQYLQRNGNQVAGNNNGSGLKTRSPETPLL